MGPPTGDPPQGGAFVQFFKLWVPPKGGCLASYDLIFMHNVIVSCDVSVRPCVTVDQQARPLKVACSITYSHGVSRLPRVQPQVAYKAGEYFSNFN